MGTASSPKKTTNTNTELLKCLLKSQSVAHGKMHVLKAVKGDDGMRTLGKITSCEEKTVMEVGDVGIRLFCHLYGGHETDSLTTLRHTRCMAMMARCMAMMARCMAMMARCNCLEPQKLPPSERARYFHSLHLHFQVVCWQSLNNNSLDELELGWKPEDG